MTAKNAKITCPHCGKAVGGARSMGHHLRDKHQITGMEAHLISNPNDMQTINNLKRRKRRQPRAAPIEDGFEVIES